MKIQVKFMFVLLCLANVFATANAREVIEVEPKGVYAEIDVKASIEAIKVLKSNDKSAKKRITEAILQNPNDYIPPVLYVLSNELFKDGKKEEGSFWFYVGQLRARIDANICADESAGSCVSVLNGMYGPMINRYTFPQRKLLDEIVKKVIDFVRNNDEKYDRRWINLEGTGAFTEGKENSELSMPKEQWARIKEKTINDYYEAYMEVMKSLENK